MSATHDLSREMRAAKAIKAGIEDLTDDTDAIRDTLEGETQLHELISDVISSIGDDNALLDAIGDRIDNLKVRKERFKHRIEQKKAMIYQAMTIADLPKIETETATVSKRKIARKAVVTDESMIPTEFFDQGKPKLNRTRLNNALKEKRDIAGAELDNGGETIAIRTL